MPSAFQRQPYDNRFATGRMSDLMRDTAAVQAQATMARGQGWANQIGRMGDLVSGAIRDYPRIKDAEAQRQRQAAADAERDEAKQDAARVQQAMRDSIDPATGRLDFGKAATLIGQIDPLKAEAFWKEADAAKAKDAEKEKARSTELAKGFAAVLAIGGRDAEAGPGALQEAPRAYAAFRENAIKRGLATAEDLPEQYDEAQVQIRALETMSTAQVFDTLFRAPNAPKKRNTATVNGNVVDTDTGEVIYQGAPEPKKRNTATVDGRIVDVDTGKVVYASPDAGRGGDKLTTAQRNAAIRSRRDQIQRLDGLLADNKVSQDEYDRMRYDIELDYANQTGEDRPAPPLTVERGDPERKKGLAELTPEELKAAGGEPTMRDLFASPSSPSAPMGRGTANAQPSAAPRPAPENAPYRLNFHGKILTFKTRADAAAWAKRLGLELDEK